MTNSKFNSKRIQTIPSRLIELVRLKPRCLTQMKGNHYHNTAITYKCAIALFSVAVVSSLGACGTNQVTTPGNIHDDTVEPMVVGTASVPSVVQDQSNPLANTLKENAYEVRFLSIEPYKAECEGFHLSQCWLNKLTDEAGVEYVYETIHGFNYQWGYRYELLVGITTQTSLMSDVPQQRFELIETISQSRYLHHQSFEYVARYANESVVKIAPGKYQLAGGQTMICEATTCANIDSVLAQDQSSLMKVEYSEQPGGALKLAAVICAETRGAFNSACMGSEQQVLKQL